MVKKKPQIFLIFLVLISLFLIAATVRIYNLTGHGLLADELTWMVRSKELIYAVRARNLDFFDSAWWTIKGDVQALSLVNTFFSGLFYYFTVLGQSRHSLGIFSEIMAVRLPGAILGAIFIPVFYLLICKHVGKKTSIVAAALLAIDPVSTGVSRYLKQDSTLMILMFTSLMLYIYPSKNKLLIFGSALFGSLSFLTKPQGLLIPIVIFIYHLLDQRNDSRKWKDYFTWVCIFFICIWVLFPYLWKDPISRLTAYVLNQFQVSSAQGRLVFFNGLPTTNPPWYFYLLTSPFHLIEPVVLGLFAALVGLVEQVAEKRFRISPILIVSVSFCILYSMMISTSTIKLGTNYIYPIWPYLFLTSSYGLIYLSGYISKQLKIILWSSIFLFPLLALIKFSPNYYLYYNSFTSAKNYQERESIGFCDGIKPAIEYLAPLLHHGIKLEIKYCYPVAQYYTSYSLDKVNEVVEKPEIVIVENSVSQTSPEIEPQVIKAGYGLKKSIRFNGLELARIYIPNEN